MWKWVGIALIAVALSGCGGGAGKTTDGTKSNGEASKPAAQVLSDALRAATSASSMHFSDRFVIGTARSTIQASVADAKGAQGSVRGPGIMCDFVRVRRTLYVRGNRACIQEALSAKLPANKWLMAPVAFWAYVSPGTVQELSTVRGVVAGFTRSKRKFENAGQTTYQGHAVVALRATGPSSETLYVAASGTPYPVAVVRGGSALPETVTFDGWNAPLSLKAPKGAILPPPPSG